MAAAFNEGIYREYAGKDWERFKAAMIKYFAGSVLLCPI